MVIKNDDDDDAKFYNAYVKNELYEHCVNSIGTWCMKWNRCANVPTCM